MELKKKKKVMIIIICICVLILVLSIGGVVMVNRFIGSLNQVEINTDITRYNKYMDFGKKNADEAYYKWGMDESIWPKKITDSMNIKDYKMVRNQSFDTEYIGYLVINYSEDDYKRELKRLKKYDSAEYLGVYEVTGAPKGYDLLAIHTNKEKSGFVYALGSKNQEIVYIEIIFCNYFMDTDYTKYLPSEYVLSSFNVSNNNKTRKEFEAK